MDEDLKKLKSILRSLVVSSPVTVYMTTLLRDYREMVGSPLPLTRYGYRDPLKFLEERFGDCFLFQGPARNPELILIVPDSLKHIDKFVQNQKTSPFVKFKGKKRSVLESSVKPHTAEIKQTNTEPSKKEKIVQNEKELSNRDTEIITNGHGGYSVEPMLKKALPPYNSIQDSINETESTKSKEHSSGRLTSSSSRSLKEALEEVKEEIKTLIYESPEAVGCSDLLDAYKERFGRKLNFVQFGFTSIVSLVARIDGVCACQVGGGEWRAWPASAPARRPAPRPRLRPRPRVLWDTDDALPGVDFEPGVFPEDCMQLGEGIPELSLDDVQEGDELEVMLGEVYSPSHFWMMRLGDQYNIALDALIDEMTEYYTRGEGQSRRLAVGAVREGHFCSSCYDGNWHRSVLVRVLDSDTVKLRHVDYGTVETCSVSGLRPLLRRWARLPVQATRGRLGSCAPAGARVWPRPAAAAFLAAVSERRLVAQVMAKQQENILEVLLIDTSQEEDVCIQSELIQAGHAVLSTASSTSECYLYPRFEALESGATPNYAEIHAYIRDGVILDFVEEYRRHVPAALPSRSPSPAASPDLTSDTLASDSSAPPTPPPEPAYVPAAPLAPSILSGPTPRLPRAPNHITRVTLQVASEPNTNANDTRHRQRRTSTPNLIGNAPPAPPLPPVFMGPFPPPMYQQFPAPFPYPYPMVPFPRPYMEPGPAPHPRSADRVTSGRTPPPPYPPGGGVVSIPASECEIFATLSRVDPAVAQRYMLDAISRASAATSTTMSAARPVCCTSSLNPEAAGEYRCHRPPGEGVRPPPGFQNQ